MLGKLVSPDMVGQDTPVVAHLVACKADCRTPSVAIVAVHMVEAVDKLVVGIKLATGIATKVGLDIPSTGGSGPRVPILG